MRRGGPYGGKVRIALVTGNRHKLEEVSRLAEGSRVEFYTAPTEKLEVQSESLEEIALKAARHAFEAIRRPLVVDDSGLFVEALNGFPGPYSSYVFKTIGIGGILKLLENAPTRRACFLTVAALILPPVERVFRGITCGTITTAPRGDRGFGFDPIFVPDGETRTYAEMTLDEKNTISHRAKAFSSLIDFVEGLYS